MDEKSLKDIVESTRIICSGKSVLPIVPSLLLLYAAGQPDDVISRVTLKEKFNLTSVGLGNIQNELDGVYVNIEKIDVTDLRIKGWVLTHRGVSFARRVTGQLQRNNHSLETLFGLYGARNQTSAHVKQLCVGEAPKQFRNYQLSIPDFGKLAYVVDRFVHPIDGDGPAKQGEVAAKFGVSDTAITKLVNRFEKQGLLYVPTSRKYVSPMNKVMCPMQPTKSARNYVQGIISFVGNGV